MQFFDEIGLDLWVLTEQVAGPEQGDCRGFMASQKKGHHLIAQLRIRRSADGVVFKLDPTGTETELHSFTGGGDGGYPAGLVLDRAGNLYGTTDGGGAYGYGTVFKLVPGLTTNATVSPSSLTFGSQTVGTTSPIQTITLTNAGSVDITISSVTAWTICPACFGHANQFAETNNCGSSLAPGGSCQITVTFTPTTGTPTGT